MKKLLLSFTGLLLSALFCLNSFALNNVRLSKFSQPGNTNARDLGSNPINPKGIAAHSVATSSDRALKHFNSLFPTVTDVSWVNDKKTITASFKRGDVLTNVTYNRKGKWSHTFVYYPGTKLSSNISSLILDEYPGYDVLGVTEIHMYNLIVYSINIQNAKNIKRLLVHNGSITIYDEFDRAN